MNRITFTPIEEDVIAAGRLLFRATFLNAIIYGMAAILVILLVIYVVDDGLSAIGASGIVAGGGAGLIAWLAYVRFWGITRSARKTIQLDKTLALETFVEWDDQAITMGTESGQQRINFADLPCWLGNDQVTLLFRSQYLYHFLPRRAFPDDALYADLIGAVTAHGIEKRWPPK